MCACVHVHFHPPGMVSARPLSLGLSQGTVYARACEPLLLSVHLLSAMPHTADPRYPSGPDSSSMHKDPDIFNRAA